MKFYAVAKGRIPGIYMNWEECKQQVNKFSGEKFKGFENLREAENYMAIHCDTEWKIFCNFSKNRITNYFKKIE
jgi:viroplasmin and RNaseH domain-containing protein